MLTICYAASLYILGKRKAGVDIDSLSLGLLVTVLLDTLLFLAILV